jgi:hypothetical protein
LRELFPDSHLPTVGFRASQFRDYVRPLATQVVGEGFNRAVVDWLEVFAGLNKLKCGVIDLALPRCHGLLLLSFLIIVNNNHQIKHKIIRERTNGWTQPAEAGESS